MKLRGVVESTFGGALCLRGFARIGDLAKISDSKDYQRSLDESRAKGILEYLQNSSFRFFPELIFGLQLERIDAIQNIQNGKRGEISAGIKLSLYTKDFTDYASSDKLESPLLRRISLTFSTEKEKYLSRIDGNHRLSAIDDYLTQNSYNPETLNYYVPFCIILQTKSEEAEKYETAFFHLINSKSKQLTTEENLKSILSSENFNDQEIEKIIGESGVKAKKLIEIIKSYHFQGFGNLFAENSRSICLGIFKLLESKNQDHSITDVLKVIQAIDIIFSEEEKLVNYLRIDILLACIFYRLQSKKDFSQFKNWILSNQLFNIEETSANSIIDIYNTTHKKGPYMVFVAMPYFSHQHVTDYNTLFREVLKEIQLKENVELELIPIMRFRGASQRIDQRLIQKIKECDIFIADITSCNDNVIYEVGLAEGNNKPMILIKAEGDTTKVPFEKNEKYIKSGGKVPFDMDKLQYIPYSESGYYNQIKQIIKNNLPDILRVKYNEL